MKCRKNGSTTVISALSEGSTFLFNDRLCMRTAEDKSVNGQYIVGVVLETGELLYQSDFVTDDDYIVEVQEVKAECIY